MNIRRVMATAILIGSLGIAFGANAETKWQQNHPWRAHDNARLNNQNSRIKHGVKDGQLTQQQAHQLHADDHSIRTEERADASVNGSHLTAQEQRQITTQENANSRAIYAERH